MSDTAAELSYKLKSIREARDSLAEASKVKCTCTSFTLQYEGSCQCDKGKSIKKAIAHFDVVMESI